MSDTSTDRRTIRIYRPDNRFNESPTAALAHLVREAWQHRAHTELIFGRDFKAAYSGTFLGKFWNFALPLLPVSIYAFLAVIGVFPAVEDIPRSVYVSFNVTLWLLFSGLIEQPIAVIKTRNSEAMKTSLPISVAVMSSFARLVFETALRVALVAVLVVATLTPLAWLSPLSILVIGLGVVFSLAIGMMAAILNIVVPDIQSIVTVMMRYGIFLSGVIFPLSAVGPLAWLDLVNPFAILIHAARDLTFAGTLTHPLPLACLTLVTVALVLLSARTFYVMEYRIRGVV